MTIHEYLTQKQLFYAANKNAIKIDDPFLENTTPGEYIRKDPVFLSFSPECCRTAGMLYSIINELAEFFDVTSILKYALFPTVLTPANKPYIRVSVLCFEEHIPDICEKLNKIVEESERDQQLSEHNKMFLYSFLNNINGQFKEMSEGYKFIKEALKQNT